MSQLITAAPQFKNELLYDTLDSQTHRHIHDYPQGTDVELVLRWSGLLLAMVWVLETVNLLRMVTSVTLWEGVVTVTSRTTCVFPPPNKKKVFEN